MPLQSGARIVFKNSLECLLLQFWIGSKKLSRSFAIEPELSRFTIITHTRYFVSVPN